MNWKDWVIVILVGFTAAWMPFDGSRALTTGDYTTPQSGEYAGQLGPWANLIKAIGIEPRSALMKSIFVIYGISWARTALMIVCILGLWFLRIGTIANLISLILLLIGKR